LLLPYLPQEDAVLSVIMTMHYGVTEWQDASTAAHYDWNHISSRFAAAGFHRTPAQIKQRWLMKTRPGIRREPWTRDEVETLLKEEKSVKSWGGMEAFFAGRTSLDIRAASEKVKAKGICAVVNESEKICRGTRCTCHAEKDGEKTSTPRKESPIVERYVLWPHHVTWGGGGCLLLLDTSHRLLFFRFLCTTTSMHNQNAAQATPEEQQLRRVSVDSTYVSFKGDSGRMGSLPSSFFLTF
jgi:hypothetical protein